MTPFERLAWMLEVGGLRGLVLIEGWQSLLVDYEPPTVERLWRPIEGGRLYLHRIRSCGIARPLYHPHPWPSAVTVLRGAYAMEIGYGATAEPPPVAARLMLSAGSCYEMDDPNGWHSVAPVGGPVLSVMVTGEPWALHPGITRPSKPLGPLEPAAADRLLVDIQAALS